MRSIGSVLDESRGLGKGFDFLRVVLSFVVIGWHTPIIATYYLVQEQTARFFWQLDYTVMPMFFALSGFLITGSAIRLTLKDFLINRALRIGPALAVEVCLSAFLIGAFFTTLPLSRYFTDPHTYRYFTNIVGVVNFTLPGVFVHNPAKQVNVSLWTLPYELGCYIFMAICIRFALLKKPWTIPALAAGLLLGGLLLVGFDTIHGHTPKVDSVLYDIFIARAFKLMVSFLLGVALYLYRYKIPYSWPLFIAAVLYCCLLASLGHARYQNQGPVVVFLFIFPVVYITGFLGVSNLPALPLFHRGDYSYGIYLYGWPIMQAMRSLFPELGKNFVALWLISVPLITLFAIFSWHTIEKPVVRIRKSFSFIARQRLAAAPPTPELAGAAYDQPIIGEIAGQALDAAGA